MKRPKVVRLKRKPMPLGIIMIPKMSNRKLKELKKMWIEESQKSIISIVSPFYENQTPQFGPTPMIKLIDTVGKIQYARKVNQKLLFR